MYVMNVATLKKVFFFNVKGDRNKYNKNKEKVVKFSQDFKTALVENLIYLLKLKAIRI